MTGVMKFKSFMTVVAILLVSGCGVDKNNPKYDELRYNELQSARCDEMAYVLSAAAVMEKPDDYEVALKRCEDTKSLSFEQYKLLMDSGRTNGVWDIYEVFPDKQ